MGQCASKQSRVQEHPAPQPAVVQPQPAASKAAVTSSNTVAPASRSVTAAVLAPAASDKPAAAPAPVKVRVINPAIHVKAAPAKPVDLLAGLPEKDPAKSAGFEVPVDPADESLPSNTAVENHWRAAAGKQFFNDVAAEVADVFSSEKLPAPGPAVFAMSTGLLRIYHHLFPGTTRPLALQRQVTDLSTALGRLDASGKGQPSYWAHKVLTRQYEVLTQRLRVLGPSFTEPLEFVAQHTNRPTPDTQAKARRSVAKRVALITANAQTNRALLDEVTDWLLCYSVAPHLPKLTDGFALGPARSFESQTWYAFWADMPEVISWSCFQKAFVSFKHWPEGIEQLVSVLRLYDGDASAWSTFKANIQGKDNVECEVRAEQLDEAFPSDLLGPDLLGALKRYFTVDGYRVQLPQHLAEKRANARTVISRLAKEFDRHKRQTSFEKAAECLWELAEKLWYAEGAKAAAMEAGVGSRALAALESTIPPSHPCYIPAAVIIAQLAAELSLEPANIQRVAHIVKRPCETPLPSSAYHKFTVMLAKASMAQYPHTWKDLFGGTTLGEWHHQPDWVAPATMFAYLDYYLSNTQGKTWRDMGNGFLGEMDPCPGLVRFHPNVRRHVLLTLRCLAHAKQFRRYYTDPHPVEGMGTVSVLHTLLAVGQGADAGDAGPAAMAVLEELPKLPQTPRGPLLVPGHGRTESLPGAPAPVTWGIAALSNSPAPGPRAPSPLGASPLGPGGTSSSSAAGPQGPAAHQHKASRSSANAHSRGTSLASDITAVTASDAGTAMRHAMGPRHARKNSLATADRAARRTQEFAAAAAASAPAPPANQQQQQGPVSPTSSSATSAASSTRRPRVPPRNRSPLAEAGGSTTLASSSRKPRPHPPASRDAAVEVHMAKPRKAWVDPVTGEPDPEIMPRAKGSGGMLVDLSADPEPAAVSNEHEEHVADLVDAAAGGSTVSLGSLAREQEEEGGASYSKGKHRGGEIVEINVEPVAPAVVEVAPPKAHKGGVVVDLTDETADQHTEGAIQVAQPAANGIAAVVGGTSGKDADAWEEAGSGCIKVEGREQNFSGSGHEAADPGAAAAHAADSTLKQQGAAVQDAVDDDHDDEVVADLGALRMVGDE